VIEEAGALSLAGKRLRWRARRGLLENDLLITRFLNRHGDRMTSDQMVSFEALLDLPENELLDLLLARQQLPSGLDVPGVREMLDRLRTS
jgi:antitoxin CptB